MLKKKVIGIVLTQKMADERYVKKDEPTPTPTLVRVEWRNAAITPNPVNVGQTATISGNVFAIYSDSTETDVTAVATYSANGGTISGNTFTANAADTYSICANYQGYASAGVEVVVQAAPVQYKNVFVGAGTEYSQVSFTDTGRQLSNNMVVEISNNDGEYLFIKVDKNNTVNNLYTVGAFEFSIALDAPVTDVDYKYYKSTNAQAAGTNVQYNINKV